MRFAILTTLGTLSFLATACGSSSTEENSQSKGAAGASALISSSKVEAGDDCADGGLRLEFGADTNGDGKLDDSEVEGENILCNAGADAGVKGEAGEEGEPGAQGGAGPIGETGPQGEDGKLSLLEITPEPAGDNCAAGGSRIDAGLDDNNDGVLDAGEIDSTGYACTGEPNTLIVGLSKYSRIVEADGDHGIESIKYWDADYSAGVWTIHWPVAFVDDASWVGSGTPTNGYWHGLHSGCGNSNGVATCTAVCSALDMSYVEVNTNCGTNYPTENLAADGRNIYMSNNSGVPTGVWNTYQPDPALGNGNNMEYCKCAE